MKNKYILKFLGLGLFLSVIGCATRSTPPAPVVNVTQIPTYAQAGTTAPSTNVAPHSNNTTSNTQKPQLTAVTSEDDDVQTTPVKSQHQSGQPIVAKTADSSAADGWQMPTDGSLGKYSASGKGVNITGTEGQPIYAVASGKVLYSGNGLKGYGNLIIVRHDNTYLSAYAYNKTNLVKEGAAVKQGQKIATMGTNDAGVAMLHLEVRKNGKPIDPHSMLGN